MGTSVALSAAKRCDPLTEPVILIEKGHLGSGSSGRTGAVIHQGYPERALAGMARDALKVYANMQAAAGRSVGYKKTGVLVVAGTEPDAIETLERDVAMQREIAIDVRVVNATEMRKICPGIEVASGAMGSYEPDGGYVEPKRTIDTLAALARSKGASTRTGVENPTVLVENGRAVGVATSEGEFRAPNVVLATRCVDEDDPRRDGCRDAASRRAVGGGVSRDARPTVCRGGAREQPRGRHRNPVPPGSTRPSTGGAPRDPRSRQRLAPAVRAQGEAHSTRQARIRRVAGDRAPRRARRTGRRRTPVVGAAQAPRAHADLPRHEGEGRPSRLDHAHPPTSDRSWVR